MAEVTASQIRARLQAILATVPGITTVLTGKEKAIEVAQLPAVVVWTRGATRTREQQNTHVISRTFDIVLFVDLVTLDERHDQQADFDAAEAWLDVIPDFLVRNAPRLELNNAALANVRGINEPTDEGAKLHQWNKQVFSGIGHIVRVNHIKFVR